MDGTTDIKIDYYEELKAKADKYDEKETPFKPTDKLIRKNGNVEKIDLHCTKCFSRILYHNQNYCMGCGGKIDWTDL